MKSFLAKKTLALLTLSITSWLAPQLVLQSVLAQPTVELKTRPAITTENDRILVNSLIKSSLLSLNAANMTGNYSVLRESSSPAFQANNTDESLAQIFQEIRETQLDFAAITEYQPIFVQEPSLDEQNNLRVKGYFKRLRGLNLKCCIS